MKITAILIAAMGMTLLAHATETPEPVGRCFETPACQPGLHAAPVVPIEVCGQLLKRSGAVRGSWKVLGGDLCASLDLRNVPD